MGYNPDCPKCVDPPITPITPPKDPASGGGLPPGGNAGQVLTKASGADNDVIWADGGSGGGTLLQDIVATKTVGGVTEGTRIPAGTSFEELFRWILAPAMTPTLTPPSATLTAQSLARTIYGHDEIIGNVTFNLSFDRGKIQPAYGTDGYRSGPATSYKVDGVDGQVVTIDMDVKLPSGRDGKVTITGVVAHSAGPQPKDSKGDNYGSPLAAGSVTSNGVTIERKHYLYSTKYGSFDRLPITEYNSTPLDITQAHDYDGGNPSKIGLPARAKTIEVWNEVTRDWQDDKKEFPETTQVIDGITYYIYTDNRPYSAGNRRIRFTW